MPWALIGALALIVCFEAGLRASRYPRVVPYEVGLEEYYAVAAQLDHGDAAEVAIVGSSRARESIHLETLAPILERAAGRRVAVANYGLSRARAYDFEAVVRRLVREPRRPRVIVCGVSERDLARGIVDAFDMAPVFWNLRDWRASWSRRGMPALQYLPIVARNHLGTVWRTLQLREQLRIGARSFFIGPAVDSGTSPIRGESTHYHRTERRKSLSERPVTPERVDQYVQSLHLSPYPDGQMTRALAGMISECRRANVTLILYEVPIPGILRDRLPPGIYDRFVSLVDEAAREGETPFIRADKLRVRLGDFHFREQSHMNFRGARAFTAVLGESVIARSLKQKLEKDDREKARKKRDRKRKAKKK